MGEFEPTTPDWLPDDFIDKSSTEQEEIVTKRRRQLRDINVVREKREREAVEEDERKELVH